MALFLAGLVDQLDLALEHISKGGLHNSRIGLMLTDNVLELVLFQIVKSKQSEAMRWRSVGPGYAYSTQLRKALLGSFSDKIDFAKLEGALEAEKARTFNIMHHYRNDIYHAGLAHEAILPSLARFYFEVTCLYVGSFDARCLSWTSGQQMPDRARKYFGDRLSGVTRNNFAEVCDKLAMASGHDDSDLVAILAEHLEEIIGNVDTCVQIVANGVYKGQEMSRDAAVIETQAWELAFDEKGRSFASERGFVGSAHGLVDFLLAEYQFEYRRDPIRSWKAQASKLKSKTCPHMALEHYQSFVRGTGAIRASLEQSAAAAEAEIEAASDRMREK